MPSFDDQEGPVWPAATSLSCLFPATALETCLTPVYVLPAGTCRPGAALFLHFLLPGLPSELLLLAHPFISFGSPINCSLSSKDFLDSISKITATLILYLAFLVFIELILNHSTCFEYEFILLFLFFSCYYNIGFTVTGIFSILFIAAKNSAWF